MSALVAGEVWRGIEAKRQKDAAKAAVLEVWFAQIRRNFAGRILPADEPIALVWGRLTAGRTKPVLDTYIAATAIVHGLTVATRNTRDFAWTGVSTFDPFAFAG